MTMWGVYRVLKNGKLAYVSRSATHSEKLAREIADDLTNGIVIMPDGSTRNVEPRHHVARIIGKEHNQ